jgi:uncharacterized repeat protein (TIGR01451 family)
MKTTLKQCILVALFFSGIQSAFSQSLGNVAPLQISLSHIGNGCNGGNSIIITSPNGQPDRLSFILLDELGNEYNEPDQSDTISGLDPGKYYIKAYEEVFFVVSFSNSFNPLRAAIDSIIIPKSFNFNYSVTTQANCSPVSPGVINVSITGGSSPYVFNWSDSLPMSSLSGTTHSLTKTGGEYQLFITDNNNCTIGSKVTIPFQSGFSTILKSEQATCGFSDGDLHSFTTGGTAPYTFFWSNGNTQATLVNIPSGSYNVKVTDNNGCVTNQFAKVVSYKRRPTITISGLQASCNNSGVVTATISGPSTGYSLIWHTSPAQNSMTGTGLPNRWFPVSVIDQFGCRTRNTIPVSAVINPAAQTLSNTTCGVANGSGRVTPSNGTSPYTVLWSNGATTQSISGLASGVYTAVVTDAVGCQAYQAIYIDITNLNASIGVNPPSENSCKDGMAGVSCTGCTAPQFTWNHYPISAGNSYNSLKRTEPVFVNIIETGGCLAQARQLSTTAAFTATHTITTLPTSCGAISGSATINFSYPPSTNNTVEWYDGQNTSPTNSTATAINLPAGFQSVRVTNGPVCEKLWAFSVSTGTGLSLSAASIRPTCNLSNGIIEINPQVGTAPFQYVWNTQPIHADSIAYLLTSGTYQIQVTDALNCVDNITVTLLDSGICHSIVEGLVFADFNGNGQYDTGESGMSNRLVWNSGFAALTNSVGRYSFLCPTGTQSIHTAPLPGFIQTLPQSNQPIVLTGLVAGITYSGNDFGFSPISNFQDLTIAKGHIMQPRHVQPYRMYVDVLNKGNTVNTPIVSIDLPAQTTYLNSYPAGGVYQSGNHRVVWPLNPLTPYTNWSGYAQVSVPTTIPMGASISSTGTIDPENTDSIPLDNVDSDTGVVSAPYDPNDIMLIPDNHYGLINNIHLNDTLLTYRIRFQNTGNDTAFNVTILDTLDNSLDLESFEYVMSSDSVQITFEPGRVARFYFPMIMLPDSTTDFIESQGMVVYRIKGNAAINYTVKNKAAIYFDLNAPVITQESQYTWVQETKNEEEIDLKSVSIYPNPTNNVWHIDLSRSQESWLSWKLLDIEGRVLEVSKDLIPGERTFALSSERLPIGIYFFILESNQEKSYFKLIKN